jgi:hydrogenase maturation protein HypF
MLHLIVAAAAARRCEKGLSRRATDRLKVGEAMENAVAPDSRISVEIRVRGRVQGVGFRPTVWRLASELGLDGEVLNDGSGVLIRLRGAARGIDALLGRLQRRPPPLARIDRVERRVFAGMLPAGFRIAASEGGAPHTEVAPDAALCAACAAEILTPGERRHGYAFANCTHCGPRLSIVHAMPYDRARTTMAAFAPCPDCAAEYRAPANRRFHAEPIACPACGPHLALLRLADGMPLAGDAIEGAARLLVAGEIVALKGLGGYQLACDATNGAAVARLRSRKRRDAKPFALMARDLATIRRCCAVSAEEERVLGGAAAPIVLLRAAGLERLPEAVAPGLDRLGFMLPTTPLHLLLLRALDRPAVMTSGNLSDEPQVTEDGEVGARLAGIAGYALAHDREIANRVDDSVVRVVAGKARLVRRARGYAPAPLRLPPGFAAAPEILAMGGELKATFCLVKDGQAILSQHLGDLEHPAAFDDYRRNLALYRALFDHAPAALAADLHPEYLSAKLGRERARDEGLPLVAVQHHHAHIAACLAENGRPLAAPPVLGIALDGLGWGDDGTFWGGEFLLVDYRGYRRLARLAPVAMPGGARAVREPWRNLYAQLSRALGWPEAARQYARLALSDRLAAKPLATLDRMIAGYINSPPASSCGRLFDAVAAALDIAFERQAYEGEAAMRLEALVDPDALAALSGYRFAVRPEMLDPKPMWKPLLRDLAEGVAPGVVAARFHKGLAEAIATLAGRLARHRGLDTVALSGGCFQNAVLFGAVVRLLEGQGLIVLSHAAIPANDGGLAVGQAAVAAARLIGATSACA